MSTLVSGGLFLRGWRRRITTAAMNPGMISLFVLSCVWLGGAAETSPPRLPRENVLLYRTPDGSRTAKSPDQWQKRKSEILAAMQSVMGALPGDSKRIPLAVKIEEEVDCGSYVRRLITYASEPGSRTPAYLCIPKSALKGGKKVPAVLCLHPTDNKIGHKVVVGLGGRANRQYAQELAERGYVTLSPGYPMLANYWPDVLGLGHESGTMKAIWDNIRGVDYLATLPFVDTGRGFGTIGHSLGGHNSVYTAVFDERIKVIVSSCGLDAYTDYYGGDEKRWLPEKGWCQTRYMPKLANYRGRLEEIPYDFHEMIAALAPRVCFINAPLGDSNFRWQSVDRVVAAAGAAYELYGERGNLTVEHPDSSHDFPDGMRTQAYSLIERVLGKP
jgi:dienelactone hydrolase